MISIRFLPSSQDTNINMERAFDQLLQLARTKKSISNWKSRSFPKKTRLKFQLYGPGLNSITFSSTELSFLGFDQRKL